MQPQSATSASAISCPAMPSVGATPSSATNLSVSGRNENFSRDEMNLAEFPLAALSTRVDPSIKTLEFRDTTRLPTGEVVERKWIITGADKFGLPTSTDDDVVLGLIRLTMDHGFRERKVYFTRYELLKVLRWTTEGRSYSRLIKSLDRLSGVRLRSSNSFYDNQTKAYQTCNFGIIDAYEINDERASKQAGEGEARKSFFIWSEMLFDSFKAGFIKKLDLDLYFSLKSSVSRRLYRYLDKHFYYKSTVESSLMVLAFEKIGLSRSYKYISSIRQQIEPAAEELIKAGFLVSCEFNGRGEQTTVRFVSSKAGAASVPDKKISVLNNISVRENTSEALPDHLMKELIRRGIAQAQARKLMQSKSLSECQKIELILRYYDHLVGTNDRRISRNKIGFLYRAVESPYKFCVPPQFGGGATAAELNVAKVSRSPRPELKVYRATRRVSEANFNKQESGAINQPGLEEETRKSYMRFCMKEVSRAQETMSAEEKNSIYREIQGKMGFLRSMLGDAGYRHAIEGAVQEEIKRRVQLPDYTTWLQNSMRI